MYLKLLIRNINEIIINIEMYQYVLHLITFTIKFYEIHLERHLIDVFLLIC